LDYYLKRTSHGSTLSGIVHSWVLSRSSRRDSWALFNQALQSDINDIQGGTTAEGIHLGAMAGTIDLLQRCYPGLELYDGELRFNPVLPDELSRLNFLLRYRGHSLRVDITHEVLSIASEPAETGPVTIRIGAETRRLSPGERIQFFRPRAGSNSTEKPAPC
jgi:alpha,alpha-trehalase